MKIITRHIDRLFLDPNNYRFIDKPEYKFVLPEKLTDVQVQQRSRHFLLGKNNDNVQDLIASFRKNGFLPVNQIQVKELPDNRFLVLEGNRRIATLKYFYEKFKEEGVDLGMLDESIFKSISVVLHSSEGEKEHLIVMGLDHITGKKKWNPVNQAQLIEDLNNKYGMGEDDICSSLGITKHALRRSRRTLALIKKYKSSDYGDQFASSMYSIFEEIINRTELKNWLEWDDFTMSSGNKFNEEKIFSWISKEENIEWDVDGNEISREVKEPIITKALEIRDISKYINEPAAIQRMEETRNITEGFVLSDAVGESKFENAIGKLQQDVSTVFNFSEYMQSVHLEKIKGLRDKIDRLLPATNGNISPYIGLAPVLENMEEVLFSEIKIIKYRKLNNLSIKFLNRINIFAGKNNSGKTSLLETVYLLSQLNDINAFLELERYRGKFYESFNPKWLAKNLTERFDLSASYGNASINLSIFQEPTEENIDKTGYISTIVVDAEVDGNSLESNTHLFSGKEPEIYYQKNSIICHAAFTSPYRYNEGILKKAHAVAIRERFIDVIINFIREKIDDTILRIEMANIEGESRFYVQTENAANSIDITKYGEGVQRVFEIALMMGYCQNGILCIDEFESAIHKSLLVDFSKFVHELAERFNVQVFLSTHSKECIDAFVENKYKNNEITAYALSEKSDGQIECKYVDGKRLESLIDSINIDIRG